MYPSKLKDFLPKLKIFFPNLKNPANPFVGVAEQSVKKSLNLKLENENVRSSIYEGVNYPKNNNNNKYMLAIWRKAKIVCIIF